MMELVRAQLGEHIDEALVDKLLEHYTELKRRYYLGDHEPGELNGAKFAEVVLRILQHATNQPVIPLGQPIQNFEGKAREFANLPSGGHPDSIRLHIPRVLVPLYDIRNNRGVGHVHGDLSPNLPDATFVMMACDWVLAELLRNFYAVSPEEAQMIVDSIVEIKPPAVQDFQGFLQVLDGDLETRDQILLLLHRRGRVGATREELDMWLEMKGTRSVGQALRRLKEDVMIVCPPGQDRYFINTKGELYVMKHIPLQVAI